MTTTLVGNCKDCRRWHHHVHHNGEWHECDLDWVERYDEIDDGSAAIYAEAADDTNLTTGLKTGAPIRPCQVREKKAGGIEMNKSLYDTVMDKLEVGLCQEDFREDPEAHVKFLNRMPNEEFLQYISDALEGMK